MTGDDSEGRVEKKNRELEERRNKTNENIKSERTNRK
jgi:hypothetical protein